ncbi:MAG: methionyl-tRNA formyltransferase [Alphaproteobacteria bacterium]
MRLVLIGQAAFGQEVLSGLVGRGHEVALVYAPPEKGGKADPLAAEAAKLGLEVRTPPGYKSPEVAAEVASAGADLGVLAFVTKIVPPAVIDAPRLGTLCFHPSLLPRYRGGSALAWQLIRGEPRGGFTVFWTDPGIDTGPILLAREVEIGPDDTAGSLYFDKIFKAGVAGLIEAVDLVAAGRAPRLPQDESSATYDPLCGDEHAAVRWAIAPKQVYDLVRGCDPQPGAHAALQGGKLRLFDARPVAGRAGARPGEVLSTDADGLVVAVGPAGEGALRFARLRGPGPKAKAAEVAAALGLAPGAVLGDGAA